MIAQTDQEMPSDEQVDLAVGNLKLLADPTRLRILWALLHGEHSVNCLADPVGAQPAAVSQHLAKLRLARLVRTRRQGNHVLYLADNSHVRQLVEEALFHADHIAHGLADHDQPQPGRARKSGRTARATTTMATATTLATPTNTGTGMATRTRARFMALARGVATGDSSRRCSRRTATMLASRSTPRSRQAAKECGR